MDVRSPRQPVHQETEEERRLRALFCVLGAVGLMALLLLVVWLAFGAKG